MQYGIVLVVVLLLAAVVNLWISEDPLRTIASRRHRKVVAAALALVALVVAGWVYLRPALLGGGEPAASPVPATAHSWANSSANRPGTETSSS